MHYKRIVGSPARDRADMDYPAVLRDAGDGGIKCRAQYAGSLFSKQRRLTMKSNLSKQFWTRAIRVLLLIATILLAGCGTLPSNSSIPSPVVPIPTPSINALDTIERAFNSGEITEEQRILYLTYALYDENNLPPQYHSTIPRVEDETWFAFQIQSAIRSGEVCKFSSFTQSELRRILGNEVPLCDSSNRNLLTTVLLISALAVLIAFALASRKKILHFLTRM